MQAAAEPTVPTQEKPARREGVERLLQHAARVAALKAQRDWLREIVARGQRSEDGKRLMVVGR